MSPAVLPEDVGNARIRENEKIAEALKNSIRAGEIMYSPVVRAQMLAAIAADQSTQPAPAAGDAKGG
jgi:hypothetical protein